MQKIKFPKSGWGTQLLKMPLFTKAKMNNYIENSGKLLGSSHHSVPTSWRKAKTFLEDEYLTNVECTSDEKHFYFHCKCYHSFRKNDEPHNIKLALCIVSGSVVESTCSCVAGKTGYCNRSLALMLKMCKLSLFESKSTQDLVNEADQNPEEACTSKLQTWHRKGRGDTIFPQPVMDIIVKKTKLSDNEKKKDGIKCLLYEARNKKLKKLTLRILRGKLILRWAWLTSQAGLVNWWTQSMGKVLLALYQAISCRTQSQILMLRLTSVPRCDSNNQEIETPSLSPTKSGK